MVTTKSIIATVTTVILTLAILSLFIISINQQERDEWVLAAILVLTILWIIAAVATVAFSQTRGRIEGSGGEWGAATLISPRNAAFVQFVSWLQRKR